MRQTNKSLLSLPQATHQLMVQSIEHGDTPTQKIERSDDEAAFSETNTTLGQSVPPRRLLSWPSVMLYGLVCLLLILIMSGRGTQSQTSSRQTSGLQPLNITADMQSMEDHYQEDHYEIDMIFPPEVVSQAMSTAKPNNKGQTLRIGVYQQMENIARWKNWASQHHFSLVTVKLVHNQGVYQALYLCELEPAAVDTVATQIANISGESPLRVNDSPCRLNRND